MFRKLVPWIAPALLLLASLACAVGPPSAPAPAPRRGAYGRARCLGAYLGAGSSGVSRRRKGLLSQPRLRSPRLAEPACYGRPSTHGHVLQRVRR